MGSLFGGPQTIPTQQNTLQNINQASQQQQQQDYATAQQQQAIQNVQQQNWNTQNQNTWSDQNFWNSVNQAATQQANPLAMALGQSLLGNAQAIGQGGQYPLQGVAPLNQEQLQSLSGLYGAGLGIGQSLIPAGVGYLGQGAGYINAGAAPLTAQDVQGMYNPMAGNITNQLLNVFAQQNLQNRVGQVSQTGGVGADRAAVAQGLMANQQGMAAGNIYADLYQRALDAAMREKQGMVQAGGALAGLGLPTIAAGVGGLGTALTAATVPQQQRQAELQAQYQQALGQYQDPFLRLQAQAGALGPLIGLGGTTQTTGTTVGGQAGTGGMYGTNIGGQQLYGTNIGQTLGTGTLSALSNAQQAGSQTGSATGSTTYPAASPIGQITGLGATGLGLASLLGGGTGLGLTPFLGGKGSDYRMKTDVQRVGTDPRTKLPLYAFRYKGDPKSYPKTIGPMAQDVAKRFPGAVAEIPGKKHMLAIRRAEGGEVSEEEQGRKPNPYERWMKASGLIQKGLKSTEPEYRKTQPIEWPATRWWQPGRPSFQSGGATTAPETISTPSQTTAQTIADVPSPSGAPTTWGGGGGGGTPEPDVRSIWNNLKSVLPPSVFQAIGFDPYLLGSAPGAPSTASPSAPALPQSPFPQLQQLPANWMPTIPQLPVFSGQIPAYTPPSMGNYAQPLNYQSLYNLARAAPAPSRGYLPTTFQAPSQQKQRGGHVDPIRSAPSVDSSVAPTVNNPGRVDWISKTEQIVPEPMGGGRNVSSQSVSASQPQSTPFYGYISGGGFPVQVNKETGERRHFETRLPILKTELGDFYQDPANQQYYYNINTGQGQWPWGEPTGGRVGMQQGGGVSRRRPTEKENPWAGFGKALEAAERARRIEAMWGPIETEAPSYRQRIDELTSRAERGKAGASSLLPHEQERALPTPTVRFDRNGRAYPVQPGNTSFPMRILKRPEPDDAVYQFGGAVDMEPTPPVPFLDFPMESSNFAALTNAEAAPVYEAQPEPEDDLTDPAARKALAGVTWDERGLGRHEAPRGTPTGERRGDWTQSPGYALMQAGLGMLSASGQRDARGLPMPPLAAIGKGGAQGLEAYAEGQAQLRKEAQLERARAERAGEREESRKFREMQLKTTNDIREYEYARKQGFKGSFNDYMKQQRNVRTTFGTSPQWYKQEDGTLGFGVLNNQGEFVPVKPPEGSTWAPPNVTIPGPTGTTIIPRYGTPGTGGVGAGAGTIIPKDVTGAEEQKKIGQAQGTEYADIQKQSYNAVGTKNVLARMSQLNDKAFEGAGAPGLQYARSLLTTVFGMPGEAVPAGEELIMLSNRLVLEGTGGSLGNQISNSDRDYLAATNPGLANTREGRKRMIETAIKMQDRKIEVAKLASEYRKEKGNMAGFNEYLASWAEEHPLFPKAASKAVPKAVPKEGDKRTFDEGPATFRGGRWVLDEAT